MAVKIRLLSILFILLFLGVSYKLFSWQIINGKTLSEAAKSQQSTNEVTLASRGNILAPDGSYWVLRTQKWLIWANPKLVKNPDLVADKLANILKTDRDDDQSVLSEANRLKTLLNKKESSWIILKQKVDDSTKRNIEAMKISGIGFNMQSSSFYPEASSAAQVLGFVGKNNDGGDVGYFGLEGYYELPLSGKPGFLGGIRDAKGLPIFNGNTTQVSAIPGVDLKISLDKRVQMVIEDELSKGIQAYGATGGNVTVMNPLNGEILGMASFPSFDQSNYSGYENSLFKNPIISNTFEPGSILKVVVMAAGLDAGVIDPDTKCNICQEPLKLDKYLIKTWNNEYTPDISMTDVIVHSDNVGMSFIGQKLGANTLFDYLNKFGIGQKTGIDLQGEAFSKLRERGTWNMVDLATASFGQGVAVTGIEMVKAVAAIANGGYLVTPHLVVQINSDKDANKTKIQESNRIISQKSAQETTQMMVEAVDRGEAKWAKIAGFKVAGKTGTAQIPVAGHYDPTNTNHSFIGFAPANNPKFIMLVTLTSPQSSPWAAETAAPLWFAIAKDLFPYLGVLPEE